MASKENAMLIFTDAKENNNKFYELILNDDDSISTRWGRVGAEGQKKTCYGGKYEFDRILRSKTAKGYVISKTVGINISSGGQNKIELAETAKRDLVKAENGASKHSSVLIKLVERLAEMNRHQIMTASNGNIKIDETGLISTPLGLVTASTIDEARIYLEKIEKFCTTKSFNSNDYISALEQYLRLIPQKVPTRRGWHENFFTDFSSLTAQNSLLDQLAGSLDIYKSKEEEYRKKLAAQGGIIAPEKVFQTQLLMVEDMDIINKINRFFQQSKNDRHVSANLKLKNVFELQNEQLKSRFDEAARKVGNIKMLWHGTRAFNVLSILKGGLIIPKSGGSYHITGRMFGNGVYFSDQSTKALNYSYGYWDGGAKDNNCFMFVADVAMGKEHVPSGPGSHFPVKGFDSTFAKANKSGVMNNEMIVYDINQVHLRYLCEFGR